MCLDLLSFFLSAVLYIHCYIPHTSLGQMASFTHAHSCPPPSDTEGTSLLYSVTAVAAPSHKGEGGGTGPVWGKPCNE